MALTKKQKKEKKKLHGELRGFLATHRISQTQAANFFGEKPGTFQVCLSYDRYSNEKIKSFLDRKDELLESVT